jgi:hypothetical protein
MQKEKRGAEQQNNDDDDDDAHMMCLWQVATRLKQMLVGRAEICS